MDLIKAILAEALEQCITCDPNRPGYRKLPGTGHAWCPDCKGTGQMLTDQGEVLVAFLAARLGPRFADADHTHSIH